MTTCYLGLGSNLKSPKRQLQLAISGINRIKNTAIINISKPYFNKPVGVKAQPMFYNLVISIQTSLPPFALLKKCREIEANQGRVTKRRFGSRTIDIDILLYGNYKIKTKYLEIPHPRMFERDFVIKPLLEISGSELNLSELDYDFFKRHSKLSSLRTK
ncbi:MAG: 2-amino-4-hydroxy-6-hydroxymethyldihydropteridine diphosphokinase [Legionellales bacterium RIFCSPHIGHO2_12_FULL_35_11]|nr:MAG: 2-amino-4-hydroxy-6-hydroxymethyldihydropteridine diphosphokinase [Legionellales bacterium RIFCSPHIGHO2_12_FULL_35_11]